MTSLIRMKEWESKSALFAHMEGISRTAIVGVEAEAPRKFYSFSLPSAAGASEIAVFSSGLGIKPKATLLKNGDRAIVGHDAWLTWIDVISVKLILSRRLNGVFYDFLPINGDYELIVLHELGALRVDANGAEVWAVDTDVIEQSSLDGHGNLVLKVMDQTGMVVVSIESGETLLVASG